MRDDRVPAIAPFDEPAAKRLGSERLSDQIALADIAIEIAQQRQLLLGLDALGGNLQPKPMRHFDEAFDDHRTVARSRAVLDEEAVDLEFGEGQLAQLHEA